MKNVVLVPFMILLYLSASCQSSIGLTFDYGMANSRPNSKVANNNSPVVSSSSGLDALYDIRYMRGHLFFEQANIRYYVGAGYIEFWEYMDVTLPNSFTIGFGGGVINAGLVSLGISKRMRLYKQVVLKGGLFLDLLLVQQEGPSSWSSSSFGDPNRVAPYVSVDLNIYEDINYPFYLESSLTIEYEIFDVFSLGITASYGYKLFSKEPLYYVEGTYETNDVQNGVYYAEYEGNFFSLSLSASYLYQLKRVQY